MSIIILALLACIFIIWAGWPLIQNVAMSIEVWLRRRRLGYGTKPKIRAEAPWKPHAPGVPFWQFWHPKSGCFLAFLTCLVAFIFYMLVRYFSLR